MKSANKVKFTIRNQFTKKCPSSSFLYSYTRAAQLSGVAESLSEHCFPSYPCSRSQFHSTPALTNTPYLKKDPNEVGRLENICVEFEDYILAYILGMCWFTGWMEWMSHRKRRETKQQPSILPGPAVPGCCLVSFCILCDIHSIHSVQYSVSVKVWERWGLGPSLSLPSPLPLHLHSHCFHWNERGKSQIGPILTARPDISFLPLPLRRRPDKVTSEASSGKFWP